MPGNIRFLVGVIYKRCISFVTVRGTTPIILNVSLFSIRLFLAHIYETLELVSKVEIKVDALMRENTTLVRKVKKK